MKSYREYMEMRSALEARFKKERLVAAEAILEEIRLCVREFGFAPQDIFPPEVLRGATKRRARYYDPVSGATWSGVGREPEWIRGKERKQFELSEFDYGR
ncbi:H-NS histone family protein [Paraburkholderia sp. Se-20369]|nr:H-NS histone family protein [Paraburkholderia sp. Se-20369]